MGFAPDVEGVSTTRRRAGFLLRTNYGPLFCLGLLYSRVERATHARSLSESARPSSLANSSSGKSASQLVAREFGSPDGGSLSYSALLAWQTEQRLSKQSVAVRIQYNAPYSFFQILPAEPIPNILFRILLVHEAFAMLLLSIDEHGPLFFSINIDYSYVG